MSQDMESVKYKVVSLEEQEKLILWYANGCGPMFVRMEERSTGDLSGVHIRKESVQSFIEDNRHIYQMYLYCWGGLTWVRID